MPDSIHRLLFPSDIRSVPHRRLLTNIFRSLHILCFSVFFGGIFFNQDAAMLYSWLVGTVLSGLGLLAIDLYGSCILLFEVRGISVLLKMLLLLSLPLFAAQYQLWLLILLVIFSSFVSHSTRGLRHKNLLPAAWQVKLGIHQHRVESRSPSK